MNETKQVSSTSAATASDTGAIPGTGNPIVNALYDMASTVLSEQLREMFERADDILFSSAETANGGKEQQVYLDTMRMVRMQRTHIMEAFHRSLRDALLKVDLPPTDLEKNLDEDISKWSLVEGGEIEERIAIQNMETKAVTMHRHEMVELQRRLNRLADLSGGTFSREGMSPARIIRSFQSSIHDLKVDFPIKLVILKLFDRLVLGRLSEVIVSANHLLAEHGVEPAQEPAQMPKSRSLRGSDPAQEGAPSWAHGINASVFERGGAATVGQAPAGYGQPMHAWGMRDSVSAPSFTFGTREAGNGAVSSDAHLAHEISMLLARLAEGKWNRSAHSRLPAPNVALVARMFDDYLSDPRIAENLKPLITDLQLPVMKAALSDPAFFADSSHPARRTANDLYEMLLQFSGTEGVSQESYGQLTELVQSMAQAFDLNPASILETPGNALDDSSAERFLEDQDAQIAERGRARVDRVRRIVAHQLRNRIGDRVVQKPVMRLLLSGIAPLLSMDYVRGGIEGSGWIQTMALVDSIVESIQPASLRDPNRAENEAEIVAQISRKLSGIGFSTSRLQLVLAGLLEVYLTPVESETNAPVGEVVVPVASADEKYKQLLYLILAPDAWITVVDSKDNRKYWLRVKSYFPAQNSVLLGHYIESKFLRMHLNCLATALAEGKAGLIDPSTELREAVHQLASLPFERASESLVWSTADGKPL